MDWAAVARQLGDVPDTYKRPGDTFTWLFNAYVAGLFRYTSAADGTIAQLTFDQALGNWLDVWGQLFNFRRDDGESDAAYKNRIQFLLLCGKGPPISIEKYIQVVEGLTALVIERFPDFGYQVQIGIQTVAEYLQLAINLKYVRPVGIPFLPFRVLRGGLYLGTINYLTIAPRVTGAYLVEPVEEITPSIPATTNNSVPLLPTTYLTDITINPSLAP